MFDKASLFHPEEFSPCFGRVSKIMSLVMTTYFANFMTLTENRDELGKTRCEAAKYIMINGIFPTQAGSV